MGESSPYEFRTTELDPNLLATPYEVQTNWHVITGAPSCGKTTLIDLLARRGIHTVPESARRYMESEIARGRTIDEIHRSGADLQRGIVEWQLGVEEHLPTDEVAFLDGAVPGSLAWYRAFGLDPNEILRRCFHRRYASVFILERLPFRSDGLRFADDAHTEFIDDWTYRDFCALGYNVVRVPVLAAEERLEFLLGRLID